MEFYNSDTDDLQSQSVVHYPFPKHYKISFKIVGNRLLRKTLETLTPALHDTLCRGNNEKVF